MENLFMVLILLSIAGIIIGFVKPELIGLTKKKSLQIFIPALIVSFVLFGIVADTDDNEIADSDENEEINDEEIIEDDEPEEEQESDDSEEETELDDELDEDEKDEEELEHEIVDVEGNDEEFEQDVMESFALMSLQDNFQELAEISFDEEEKEFKMLVTDPDFTAELMFMIEYDVTLDEWYGLVDSFAFMSESLNEMLGDGYTLHLLNPMNENNTLLTIVDGTVTYDAFDE